MIKISLIERRMRILYLICREYNARRNTLTLKLLGDLLIKLSIYLLIREG